VSPLIIAAVIAATPPARYEEAVRAAHLEQALTAIQEAKPAVLNQGQAYASAMERSACSSDNERLRADCLITAARRFCKSGAGRAEGKRCPLFMDVIASNVLAERELISTAQRYQIMRREKDFRKAINRQLQHRYGTLAVELRLAGSEGPLGARIDRFCQATADRSNLAWQTCAAALVWFIGRRL